MAKTKTVKKTKAKPKSKAKKTAAPAVRKSSRPWQGTTMGVLASIEGVATLILGTFLLFGGSFMNGFMGGAQMMGMQNGSQMNGMALGLFASMGIYLALFFLAVGVLDIFIAKGFFNGKFWAVALTSFFVGLSVLTGIFQLFTAANHTRLSSLFGLVLACFIAYLCYSCWISPFYARKK
jgi:hypothetical protein